MRKIIIFFIAIFSVFAVVFQFKLMLENSVQSLLETIVRFLSYFTILTNSIVAVYFLGIGYKEVVKKLPSRINFDTLTAITVYITIVGLVYQVMLRHTWNPTGLQKIVDELLHSVNPLLVIAFWFLNLKNDVLSYKAISRWLLYPLLYLIYVLIRGLFSGFFPYPFLDMTAIGFSRVIQNCVVITILFLMIAAVFVRLSRRQSAMKSSGDK